MHVGQAEVAALEFVGQAFVVDAHLVQDRRLQVVDVDGVFHGVHAEFVALAVSEAGLHAAAGHPGGEAARMMVAPVIVRRQLAL